MTTDPGDDHAPDAHRDGRERPILDTALLSGPMEPVASGDRLVAIVPADDGRDVTTRDLNHWECQRCGTVVSTDPAPDDGPIAEPVACPDDHGCGRQGPFKHATLTETERKTVRKADGFWYLPTGYDDTATAGEIWDGVRDYLYRHWDAGGNTAAYDGLTAYALSTWVRENLSFVPHLMLMGVTTGGKTRLLNTLTRVSYRAHLTGAPTPATMFRLIDGYNATYYVSEYHGLKAEKRKSLDAIIRCGQKRGEYIDRADPSPGGGWEPDAFDPFAHVAVATQYEPADDIVNRCLQVHTSNPTRDMPAEHDDQTAATLRNQLLDFRWRLLDAPTFDAAETRAYEWLAERDVVGRTREKLLPLLSVAYIADRLDAFVPFAEQVIEADHDAAADSVDAQFIEVLRDLALAELGSSPGSATLADADVDPYSAVEIPYADIARRYNTVSGEDRSARWVGHVRKRLGYNKQRKSDGTVISDSALGEKLKQHCDEFGLPLESRDPHDPVPVLPDDARGRGTCPECGNRTTLTHRDHSPDGHGERICPECAADIRAHVERQREWADRADDPADDTVVNHSDADRDADTDADADPGDA